MNNWSPKTETTFSTRFGQETQPLRCTWCTPIPGHSIARGEKHKNCTHSGPFYPWALICSPAVLYIHVFRLGAVGLKDPKWLRNSAASELHVLQLFLVFLFPGPTFCGSSALVQDLQDSLDGLASLWSVWHWLDESLVIFDFTLEFLQQ